MTARDSAPWRALRDLEPALGSRRRVLANIEAELDAKTSDVPAPGRTIAVVLLAAGAAAALLVTVPAAERDEHVRAHVAASEAARLEESSASATLEADTMVGTLAPVPVPMPVPVSDELDTDVSIDAPPPPVPAPRRATTPAPELPAPEPPPATEPPPAPALSPLRQQVEAFRAARGLSGAHALAAWRAIVEQWPDSPLREEADAAIIDALVELGRTADARAAATRFVARYPNSPRAGVYRALAEDGS